MPVWKFLILMTLCYQSMLWNMLAVLVALKILQVHNNMQILQFTIIYKYNEKLVPLWILVFLYVYILL